MATRQPPPPPENIHSLAGLYPPGKPRDSSKPYIGFAENITLGYVFLTQKKNGKNYIFFPKFMDYFFQVFHISCG